MSTYNGPKIATIVSALDHDIYGDAVRQFFRTFQALGMPNVIAIGDNAPPASPPVSNGDTYVVGITPTGPWSGQANAIAYWTFDDPSSPAGYWMFFAPEIGWIIGNQADDQAYMFTAMGWHSLSALGNVIVSGTPSTGQLIVATGPTGASWQAPAAPVTPSGTSVAPLFKNLLYSNATTSADGPQNNTVVVRVPGTVLTAFPSSWKIVINVNAFQGGGGTRATFANCVIARTALNSLIPIDTTPVTFGGTAAPVFSTLGEQTSDAINLALDGLHDYWFLLYSPLSGVGGNDFSLLWEQSDASKIWPVEGGIAAGDATASNPLPTAIDVGGRQGLIAVMRWVAA